MQSRKPEQSSDSDPDRANSAVASTLLDSYMLNRSSLRVFLISRLRSASDAEDLLQDLYLKIVAQEDDLDIANVTGYLFSMAGNLSVDRMRKEARETRFSEREAVHLREVPQVSPSSEDAALSQQAIERLGEVVRSLPRQQQCVFVMHRIEQKTHKEIAETMGISVKMVEKHMSKALRKCRSKLGNVSPVFQD